MTGIIGKMMGKSTWKVSGMESFYYYLTENCVLENMAEQINEFTVEKEEVIQQLNSCIHEAAGPDCLHPMTIKTLAEPENFVNAVTVLFHTVVSTSCIPNPWKRAIVTALHRKVPLNVSGN